MVQYRNMTMCAGTSSTGARWCGAPAWLGTGNWTVRTHESNNNNNEQSSVRIVNRETGLVHDGDQALVSDIAFLHSQVFVEIHSFLCYDT